MGAAVLGRTRVQPRHIMTAVTKPRDVSTLCQQTIAEIDRRIQAGESICASSSFQTQSAPLLHLLAQTAGVTVYFLDTGFHFPETLAYRDEMARRLNLSVESLHPTTSKLQQRSADGRFLYADDPDYCCDLNKTAPMELAAGRHDVWITGVRGDQSAARRGLRTFMDGPNGVLRYHPMLDWTSDMIESYIDTHDLPRHPLDEAGFQSIGCAPCTAPPADGTGRSGRWLGREKTECGLRLRLVDKS